MNAHRAPLSLGEEFPPAGEPAAVAELLSIFRQLQAEHDRKDNPVPRNVHSKQHGCVFGELQVAAGLPPQLTHGVFRGPARYFAAVRFSNGKQQNDELPDAHGMAIKLFDVAGPKLLEDDPPAETQDFVLLDHPVFFAPDVEALVPLAQDFRRLLTGGPVEKAGTVLKALASPERSYRILRKVLSKRPDNPLEIQYWSTTPVRFGPTAAKISLRPQLAHLPEPTGLSADKLRQAMATQLRQRETRFDFLVQLQSDPLRTPIEDATRDWDEAESPYQKVGTLILPRQTFETPEQLRFGEHLSFTPWHGIVDHQPLGGINRARRIIYEVMAEGRRAANVAPHREPTGDEARAMFRPLP